MSLLQSNAPAPALTFAAVDSNRATVECPEVMEDERPRPKGDHASHLASEDLAPYSQEELDERIVLLEAEIERVRAHRDQAAAHRDAAEALFGRKS